MSKVFLFEKTGLNLEIQGEKFIIEAEDLVKASEMLKEFEANKVDDVNTTEGLETVKKDAIKMINIILGEGATDKIFATIPANFERLIQLAGFLKEEIDNYRIESLETLISK